MTLLVAAPQLAPLANVYSASALARVRARFRSARRPVLALGD